MTIPSMDKLCQVYVKIRAKKQELTKEMETQIEALDAQLKEIAAAMKDQLAATGGTSLKTPHGTIYMTNRIKYYPMDWAVFSEWAAENRAVDLLEKRISQGNMKQWFEENPTNPPPGVQADSELTVTVRKA